MKKFTQVILIVLPCVVLLLTCCASRFSSPQSAAAPRQTNQTNDASDSGVAKFQVESQPIVSDLKRIGVNLGNWTSWGAEQLLSNVLKNPGFEGLIDRAIVIVQRADRQRFADDTSWLGRENGFWAGARFDVRTGKSAGQQGLIADSRRAAADGLPEYITVGEAPALQPGDVIALTRVTDTEQPAQWWISQGAGNAVFVVGNDKRPGSGGVRSLALKPTPGRPAEIISYLDAIGERAGKLLPIKGVWRLSLWSRSSEGSPSLTVEFLRQGSPAFLSKTFTPTKEWTRTTFEFSADDRGPAGILELHLRSSDDAGSVLLDDVELSSAQSKAFPFRPEVVSALEQLRPGYLRDWQGQLGDTLANRLAEPSARRSSRYRPGEESDFGYSLPDFLTLCARIQAIPWIVIPATFSDDELTELGRFLASRSGKGRFEEIVVEFGNENWNQLFRPAGIPDPRAHGEAAERAFQKLREGAGPQTPLRLVVNGQHANPEFAMRFARAVPSADLLALAPYFQPALWAGIPQAQSFDGLFAGDEGKLAESANGIRALGKELGVYEVNLHTTEGNASAVERDPVTAGAIAGSALAKVILDGLALGARRQCVYTLAGYDGWLNDRSDFVKLFGITRDLSTTERLRPTGLAIAMLNQAIAGDLMKSANADKSGDAQDVSIYPFRSGAGWSVAVVSSASVERSVSIGFPPGRASAVPQRLLRLDAPASGATNENANDVRIGSSTISPVGATISFRLPAYGMAVVIPREKGIGK